MPKIRYRDYKPKGATLVVIERADQILHRYAADGYSLSVRQLLYVFISEDLFPEEWIDEAYNLRNGLAKNTKNTTKNYNKLKALCTAAREGGFLDWEHIVDRGRSLERLPHWQNPERFLQSVCPQFKLDLWVEQPRRVEVWVEKDALSEVIRRACDPFDVPYFACKGYASTSSVWAAAHDRFLERYAENGQSITVLHLSDHDPSGLDMTRDLAERLQLFSTPTSKHSDTPEITVKRIALTMEQIREYDLPPNPAKETDPRSAAYRSVYGNESWELDGMMIRPGVLVELIQEAVVDEMEDPKLFAARQELQAAALAQLEQIRDDYDNITDHLGLGHLDCGDEPD